MFWIHTATVIFVDKRVGFPKVHGPPLITIDTLAHAQTLQTEKIPCGSCVCVLKLRVSYAAVELCQCEAFWYHGKVALTQQAMGLLLVLTNLKVVQLFPFKMPEIHNSCGGKTEVRQLLPNSSSQTSHRGRGAVT